MLKGSIHWQWCIIISTWRAQAEQQSSTEVPAGILFTLPHLRSQNLLDVSHKTDNKAYWVNWLSVLIEEVSNCLQWGKLPYQLILPALLNNKNYNNNNLTCYCQHYWTIWRRSLDPLYSLEGTEDPLMTAAWENFATIYIIWSWFKNFATIYII